MGGSIFLSHISEDKKLAEVVKSWIEDSFLGQVSVFASTNRGDLRSGDEWFRVITKSMTESSVVIVLCSNRSVNRSWISFEAGAGWAKGVPVVMVCYSGMSKHLLPTPLNFFQGIDVVEAGFGNTLFSDLADHLRYSKAPKINYLQFEKECLEAIGLDEPVQSETLDVNEWGIVDHQVVLEEDFDLFQTIIEDVGKETGSIGRITKSIGSQIVSAKADKSQGTYRHIQRLSKKLSGHFDTFALRLEQLNSNYSVVASRIFTSLDFAVKFDYSNDSNEVQIFLEELQGQLKLMMSAIISAKRGFVDLDETIRSTPKLQRNLDKSLLAAHEQIDAFVQNMKRTLELTSATVLVIDEKLDAYS